MAMIDIQLIKELRGAAGTMKIELDLQLRSGSVSGIIGSSGAGKTSVLKMIAGIQQPDQGKITCDQEVYYDSTAGIDLAPQQRDVGLVFQDLALFPHMDITAQLKYALAPGQDESIIEDVMQMMDLTALRHQRPQRLSGGQQQRVALARSIVQRPAVLLLDEPFSALDTEMKRQIRSYVKDIHDRYKMTIIMVSHDHGDIAELCDQVIRLDQGKVTHQGPPRELIEQGSLQLTGRVVQLEKIDGAYRLTLDIQGDLSELTISEQQATGIKQGSTIDLNIDLLP